MEQRAKEMGKSAEAKIYRTYIDKMKEKTKEMQNEDATMLRFRDLLPRKLKHALYRMSHADKYKGALKMYRDLKKDKDVIRRGLSDIKIRGIAADAYRLGHKEFDKVLSKKTRYEDNILDSLEKEMGSSDDEYFELNQVAVKIATEVYEIGQDYAKHTMTMTPGQPVLSFKLANKVIERKDIDNFANEDKIIDKYKKRYGDRWKDELEKAVIRMKKEL
jgi:predicted Zn-dependent protease